MPFCRRSVEGTAVSVMLSLIELCAFPANQRGDLELPGLERMFTFIFYFLKKKRTAADLLV